MIDWYCVGQTMGTRTRSFLLLLATLSAGCDGVFSVHGRVATTSGVPIAGAEVLAYDGTLRVKTDANGCFSFSKICSPLKHETFLLVRVRDRTLLAGTVDAPSERTAAITVVEGQANMSALLTNAGEVGVCGGNR
jgi:hypothetical protein